MRRHVQNFFVTHMSHKMAGCQLSGNNSNEHDSEDQGQKQKTLGFMFWHFTILWCICLLLRKKNSLAQNAALHNAYTSYYSDSFTICKTADLSELGGVAAMAMEYSSTNYLIQKGYLRGK